MSTYILKYLLCSGILLGFYYLVLEKESFHIQKRIYLLASLFLPFFIPLAPTAIWISSQSIAPEQISITNVSYSLEAVSKEYGSLNWFTLETTLLLVYFMIAAILSIKFAKNIYAFYKISKFSETITYKGKSLNLVNGELPPHTFLNGIYVSKQEFESDKINEKLLDHELTHARQFHSMDIIIVELMKIFIWFNPLLYYYKKAIQLNHEFLADEAVLIQHGGVYNYQTLLFETIKKNNNKIYLASNINFQLTKKRLMMMTKQSSKKRTYLCFSGLVPLIALLLIGLGNPVKAQESVTENDKDLYFAKTAVQYTDTDGSVKVIKYKYLSESIKDRIPPPPPSMDNTKPADPLPEGMLVRLKKNGSIVLGNTDDTDIDFPLPPMPPMPPAPPVHLSLQEMIDGGATVYLNGSQIKPEVAKAICAENEDDFENVDIKMNDGKVIIYINDKG